MGDQLPLFAAAPLPADPPRQPRLTPAEEIEAAFASGVLRLIVDKPRPMTRETAGFAGEGDLRGAHRVRFVHVVSVPAGGEIRGYVLVDDERDLRIRTPCYTGDWPEMDAAVLARIGTEAAHG